MTIDNNDDDTAHTKWRAIAFMALFFAATIVTLVKIIRYKKEIKNPVGVVILFMPAPIIEAVGFMVRIFAVSNPNNSGLFIANMVLLGTAPVFLTAASWYLFPALVFHAGAEYSWMKPRYMAVQSVIWVVTAFHLNIRGMQPPRFGEANYTRAYYCLYRNRKWRLCWRWCWDYAWWDGSCSWDRDCLRNSFCDLHSPLLCHQLGPRKPSYCTHLHCRGN